MQAIKNKKIWFFFALGIMIVTTVCLWQVENREKEAYINGRIVQQEDQGNVLNLPFISCNTDSSKESGARA